MVISIVKDASKKVALFNSEGLHYNIVADAIHKENERVGNPFDPSFLPYIIAGLVSFDMARFMGKNKYSRKVGFASRLCSKLQQIRPLIEPIIGLNLLHVDLEKNGNVIKESFDVLSERGANALHADSNKHFYVGATKILHFLNPEFFIIIDSNAARAFRSAWQLPFKNSTQPGFSADLYLECMKRTQSDISNYGLNRFQALEPGTPITRIYDKLTFITGSELLY
jgi:hypothetical protein